MNTKRNIVATSIVMLGIASLAGCTNKAPAPVAYIGPTLTMADLGAADQTCPPDGYTILEESSQGRWPGSVAVARIDRAVDADLPQIATLTGNLTSWWNQLFTSVPKVRDVVMMDKLTPVSPDDDIDTLVEQARRMRADLVLFYGYTQAAPGNTALAGVLRDTNSGAVVAVVQASGGPADFTPHPATTVEQDMRHMDPTYIAHRKFEQQVRRCVVTLIEHDSTIPSTQQSPWEAHERARKERERPVIIQKSEETFRW